MEYAKFALAGMMLAAVVTGDAPPPDHTIELAAEQFGQPKPVAMDAYAKAYEASQQTGTLCVYIGAKWCPHCPAAKATFNDAAGERKDCVTLDYDADHDYAKEVMAETGTRSVPQVVVYTKSGDEWTEKHVVGNKPNDIKRVMAGTKADAVGLILSPAASARSLCSCEVCPADCEANGCNCGKQSSAGTDCTSCGVTQSLPRMFFRGRR